ncbi:MAG: tetratricopeptide repeat protein [Myxococcota bacterium]
MALERDKVLQTAQKHVDKKRFEKALVEYRKLVTEDPGDVRTLLKIGDLHLKLDQHEEAVGTYEQVGDHYFRSGFSVKAIAVYKQIRGIIQRHAPHLENRYGHIVPRLAEIYTQLGLTSDALAAYDEVATKLRTEGRERDALDIFKKVVELDPQNPIAHLRVADSRARLGDIDKAVERFGEAAEIMVQLGRRDDALKVVERLLEYRRDAGYARRAAELYLERGQPNDGMAALTKLQVAFKNDPKDLDTLELLATAFDSIQQPQKAIEVLKEAARVAAEQRDRARFDRFLQTLVARAPDDPQVVRLNRERASEEDVQVEVGEADLDGENIEEVFELADDELADVQGAAAAGASAGAGAQVAGPSGAAAGSAAPEPPEATVRRLLYEAERQRAAGATDAAIRVVRGGLRKVGSSRALRERLSDLLLEAGDQDGAITEKLILAQELAHYGVIDDAVRTLDEVLLLHPGHPHALQMRENLGFPLRTEQGIEDLTLNQPLQSYDVESGGVEEALHRSRHPSYASLPALDDPFVPTATGTHPEPTAAAVGAPPGPPPSAPPSPTRPPTLAPSRVPPPRSAPPPVSPRVSQTGGALDEAALDRAEVLAEQGRFDEARGILHQQLQSLPNHPLILDRLADLDALATHGTVSYSGDYPRPSQRQPGVASPDPRTAGAASMPGSGAPPISGPVSSAHPSARPSSMAAAPSHVGMSQPPGFEPAGGSQIGASASVPAGASSRGAPQWGDEVDSLLDQVREGVAAQVEEGDAATHYDLGVAYQEMGLLQDAISELLLASRDPSRACVCLSMVGSIQLQLGDYEGALDALHRALVAPHKSRDQELAVGYELANTYDTMHMPEQALQYFEWLAQVDPNHPDPRGSIYERIQRIRTESGALPRPRAPAPPAPPSTDEQRRIKS